MVDSGEANRVMHPHWRTYPTAFEDFLILQKVHGVGPRRADCILGVCGTVSAFLEASTEEVARRLRGKLSSQFVAWIQKRTRRIWNGRETPTRTGGPRRRTRTEWHTSITAVDDYIAIQRVPGIGPRRAEVILSTYGSISGFLADTPEGVAERTRGKIGAGFAARLQSEAHRLDLGASWDHLREVLEAGVGSLQVIATESPTDDPTSSRPPRWLRGAVQRFGNRVGSLRHFLGSWAPTPSTTNL